MVMQQETRRTWKLGVALVSLLSVGACADVDGGAQDPGEGDALAQLFPRPATPAASGTTVLPTTVTPVESTVDAHFFPSISGPNLDHEDLGSGDKKDVLTIGDSWMNYVFSSGGIEGGLDRIMRNGDRSAPVYRHKGIAGVEMLASNGFGQPIPTQFDAAVRENRNIKTVIMTGGGNDILISGPADCSRGGPQCTAKLGRIRDALVQLWEKMAAAGVQDIIYVGYAEGAGGNTAPAEFANAIKSGIGQACLALTTVRCHVLEATDVVKRRFVDGIHPTPAVNEEIAKGLLTFMQNEGIRR